ncbi:uncharacterized protein VTP21DRAFT_2130 [Calcarisporiella thermophila]|uniref:uncharacterized protein n=1 Tax=Calcarisporiella thermophila TaxID=911321 RepID=UPI003743A49E
MPIRRARGPKLSDGSGHSPSSKEGKPPYSPARADKENLYVDDKANDALAPRTVRFKTPPKKPKRLKISEEEKRVLLKNLDLEVEDRCKKLSNYISSLCNSIMMRGGIEINRYPAAIRRMTLQEYCDTYGADARRYFERQAAQKYENRLPDVPMSSKAKKRIMENGNTDHAASPLRGRAAANGHLQDKTNDGSNMVDQLALLQEQISQAMMTQEGNGALLQKQFSDQLQQIQLQLDRWKNKMMLNE